MDQPVYSFGYINVKDHADYMERYGRHIPAIIAKFGGEFLAASQNNALVEGDAAGNWVVLARFPSKEQAHAFMTSEEYAPFAKLRQDELTEGSLVISFFDELPA